MMPSPGAAKGVVPKNGIGMEFCRAGVPGSADIVNVMVPRAIAAGIILFGAMIAGPLLVKPWGPKRARLAAKTGASDAAIDDRHLEPQPR